MRRMMSSCDHGGENTEVEYTDGGCLGVREASTVVFGVVGGLS